MMNFALLPVTPLEVTPSIEYSAINEGRRAALEPTITIINKRTLELSRDRFVPDGQSVQGDIELHDQWLDEI